MSLKSRLWLPLTISVLAIVLWAILPANDTAYAESTAPSSSLISTITRTLVDPDVIVSFDPSNVALDVEQSETLAVLVGAGTDDLYGAGFELDYNSNVIAITTISSGPLLQGNGNEDAPGGFFQDIVEDTARFNITQMAPAVSVVTPGTLANVTIKCLRNGVTSIDFSELTLSDQDPQAIPSIGQSANVACGDVVIVEPIAPENVHVGSEFDVWIRADMAQKLAGAKANLEYDPSVLSFVGVNGGQEFAGCEATGNNNPNDEPPGTLKLILACGNEGRSGGPLTLWIVRFVAFGVTEPDQTELSLTNVTLSDDQVGDPNPIPAVGASTTLGLIPGVCGDMNGNNVVDVFDAIVSLQILVGRFADPDLRHLILGDPSRDNMLTLTDSIMILQDIVSIIDITECGPEAPVVVDQSFANDGTNVGADINDGGRFVGQTFTAGIRGKLVGVNVDIVKTVDATGDLRVAIHTADGGVPTSTIIGETTLDSSESSISELVEFAQVIKLIEGNEYAIIVNYENAPPLPAAQGVWNGRTGDPYPGGTMVSSVDGVNWTASPDNDLHFQTHMLPLD